MSYCLDSRSQKIINGEIKDCDRCDKKSVAIILFEKDDQKALGVYCEEDKKYWLDKDIDVKRTEISQDELNLWKIL